MADQTVGKGLNKSILDFQTRIMSGTCPDTMPQNQALACLILGGPSMARIASELVQRLLGEDERAASPKLAANPKPAARPVRG
ncbi:hypothetical protein C7S18_06865 [Ahniella affigens]|uniref:Uncharacterized protein n=1 Tax=Ahniella affigens TaxID=2021234 RepID=A0A2P1PQ12_9GAMM|nr:hypothetical protein C7S18_06865 [Ahniella affigens]